MAHHTYYSVVFKFDASLKPFSQGDLRHADHAIGFSADLDQRQYLRKEPASGPSVGSSVGISVFFEI